MRRINFLRERAAEITARRIACRSYGIRLAVLLLIILLAAVPLQSVVSAARSRAHKAQADAAILKQRVDSREQERRQLDVRSAQCDRRTEAQNRTQAWRRVLAGIAEALPPDVWISEIAADTSAPAGGGGATLTLTCHATSLALATDFALALKRSPLFSSASLTATANQGSEIRFDCRVIVAAGILAPAALEQPQ
jgi:Tfp pilus assembly protein PilN